jgi:hypothetical protein
MPDGTCIRDYVHVSDLVDAHVGAVDWLAAGKPSDSFNLGNGRGFFGRGGGENKRKSDRTAGSDRHVRSAFG